MIIFTKYHGPGNTRGARISAHAPGWNLPRVYIPYPHEKSGAECHAEAVKALLKKAGKIGGNYRVESILGGYAFTPEAGFSLFLKSEG